MERACAWDSGSERMARLLVRPDERLLNISARVRGQEVGRSVPISMRYAVYDGVTMSVCLLKGLEGTGSIRGTTWWLLSYLGAYAGCCS